MLLIKDRGWVKEKYIDWNEPFNELEQSDRSGLERMYCYYTDAKQANQQFGAFVKRRQRQEQAVFLIPDHLDLEGFNEDFLMGAWMLKDNFTSQAVFDLRSNKQSSSG